MISQHRHCYQLRNNFKKIDESTSLAKCSKNPWWHTTSSEHCMVVNMANETPTIFKLMTSWFRPKPCRTTVTCREGVITFFEESISVQDSRSAQYPGGNQTWLKGIKKHQQGTNSTVHRNWQRIMVNILCARMCKNIKRMNCRFAQLSK